MIHPNCSLTDIGIHLKSIYGQSNGRLFAPLEIASRIGRNISRIMKAERTGQLDVIPALIPGVLAWSLAFADRMSIDADRALFDKYPGCCPYCGSCPCAGCVHARPAGRLSAEELAKMAPAKTPFRCFAVSQRTLGDIYPANTLEGSVKHLAEEGYEVLEATENFGGCRTDLLLRKVEEELMDVVAHLIAVANCLPERLFISQLMFDTFRHGCPGCKEPKCRCGFTVAGDGGAHSRPIES